MVFRKDSKVDAFQRQISALRQQLGTEDGQQAVDDDPRRYGADPHDAGDDYADSPYRSHEAGGYSFTPALSPSHAADFSVEASMPAIATPSVDPQTSVVAHDTSWNGDLKSSGSLHVHGTVDGSLTAHDDVYVAEEADVTATITATNVIIAGVVRGTIRCSGRFEVLPQGRVSADVHTPILIVHDGATVNGQIRMSAGEPAAITDQAAPTVVHRRAARSRA